MTRESAILVTGGSRGLGAALTLHLCSVGRDVVMNYRSAERAERVSNAASAMPGRLLAVEADVRSRDRVRSMFDLASAEYGGVGVLINCAGVNRDAPFMELTDDDWDVVVDTHLKGTFICSQEFVRQHPGGKGCIINLGAACGLQGRRNGANFCSAKGGVFALTKCMARELAPRIRVNCITPSAVDTEEVRERYELDTPEGLQRVLRGIPMERLGEHADFVHMVDAVMAAEFTTGANFFVNGGEYMQ